MGSAAIQGPLWGARANDWAQVQEQSALPLFGAALDAARVTTGTRFLDAGCGAGLASLLATLRGADVSAIDAATQLVAVARQRIPDGDIREADLEDLPFPDETFDAAIAVNSVFYAANPHHAMIELYRILKAGGRLVVTGWGLPERCDYAEILRTVGSFLPPPPPDAPPGGPFAFSQPGTIENLLSNAGFEVAEQGAVTCPFVYPDTESSTRGQTSAGVAQRAMAESGESTVREAMESVDRSHTAPDGSVQYVNEFIWVSGIRK